LYSIITASGNQGRFLPTFISPGGILLYALTPVSEKFVILGTSVHDMTQCDINKQQQQKNNNRINI